MRSLFEPERVPESPQLELNPAQRRAVEHGDGPLLVIAGAGTGKTRVITERIRSLFERDSSLLGENVLALTYTIKAAGEMLRRVKKVCGQRADGITVSTFHGFCETVLKEGAPHRRPIAPVDHWILLRRNMRRLGLEKYRRLAEPGQFLTDFIGFFSRCQDELVSAEDYQSYADGCAADLAAERQEIDQQTYQERLEEIEKQQEIARAYRASEELLREKNLVALNGLIVETVKLLVSDAALRERMQSRFRHILVDEFQDTNIAQLRLLELLTAWPRNIVAVGDNDQAIYRFRGASFGSFKLFLERFAGWQEGQDSTRFRVLLKENYRSTPNILRVATQVIAQNESSADFPAKVLEPSKPEGQRVRIAELSTAEEEAQWVALEIERGHKSGKRWAHFAVLYRQHAHRDLLVEQLVGRKIPFVISRLSILEHPVVRDVLAYLRLIARPYDDVACARVLAAPAWALEAPDLVRLAERARKERRAIYDVLQLTEAQPAPGQRAALRELLEFLQDQRKAMWGRTAREILSDLMEWLEVAARSSPQDQKYTRRLSAFAKEWEAKSETRKLPEFLEYLDYFQQANETIALDDEAPGDAVQLVTVHGAKGLEFPQVFVLRVNNRCFPASERAPLFTFPVQLMKEELPHGDFHTQEERRLFYVALTRAEEKLTLTTLTEKRGKVPTFIEDILMDPAVKRRDVLQLAPKVLLQVEEPKQKKEGCSPQGLLFAAAGPAKIFSRIAEWAETYHPAPPEPLTLSPSSVMNYRGCPQQFLFEKMWSIEGQARATLTFGRVMHSTIRRAVAELKKGNRLPFEEVQRIFEMEWSATGYEDSYQEEEYRKDGLEQLQTFYAALIEALPQILEQEKNFELDLEGNVIVKGRIDQINSLGRKDVEIVDYKTGRARKASEAARDLQLSIYALAAKEIFELNPVRLVFHSLQDNQRQATTRSAKQLQEAERVVQETAAEIRAGEFRAKPGFACRSCSYRPICPAHEEALAAEG